MTPRTLAKKIAEHAFSRKAQDMVLIDLRKVTDVADFFVVCSADSDIQVKAIADAVLDGMARSDIHPWHREGVSQKQWILLDFVDVVVHIFHRDVRKFYALEKLWGDAKISELTDLPKTPRAAAPSTRKKNGSAGPRKTSRRAGSAQ